MKVCVIGGGFVGVTTATVFAEQGHDVSLVEIDEARRSSLAAGSLPFYEPDLEEAWAAAKVPVHASLTLEAPDVVFLCVGTPSRPDGSADLSFLHAAAASVDDAGWETLVVVKSTVPPGTTSALGTIIRNPVAMNPEFLREGAALADARKPDRVVLGVNDENTEKTLRSLFGDVPCPVVVTDTTTAEMVKYASNAMLATRIAFANEIGNVCQAVGTNVDEVMHAVGMDARIGPLFLKAGLGFGGSCFPKDVRALQEAATSLGVETPILESVLASNESQPLKAVGLLRSQLGELAGKRVALMGLSFKPDTSDVRETRALPIFKALQAEGADIVCYDPKGGPEFARLVGGVMLAATPQEALMGADGCIVQTEWPEFKALDSKAWPAVVVDGRRWLDGAALQSVGVRYVAVGNGRYP